MMCPCHAFNFKISGMVFELVRVTHTFNPGTGEAVAGRSL